MVLEDSKERTVESGNSLATPFEKVPRPEKYSTKLNLPLSFESPTSLRISWSTESKRGSLIPELESFEPVGW